MFSIIAFELVVICILISINGILAMSEMAIVSARKARLQQLATEGDSGAKAALRLASEPSDFLASIQIGITSIGVLAGAFSGATIAEIIGEQLIDYPRLAPYGEAIGLGIVVVFVTTISLIFGELVPKRLALANAERIASRIARPIGAISFIARPLVRLLSIATEGILRLLGAGKNDDPPVTEEEVTILIEQGTTAGVFEKEESTMMKRVLQFGDRRVAELMTPRLKVVSLDVDAEFSENISKILSSPHSSFPVYEGATDHVIGVITEKDVLDQVLKSQTFYCDLRTAMSEPFFVSESTTALRLLERFKETGRHMALVVDEYGVKTGLITLTDVTEAIVGSMPLADEEVTGGVVRREDGSALVDGTLPIYELGEVVPVKLPQEADYQTLGGFVMDQLAKIPREGDTFYWDGYRFEVVDMDGHRVDKVLVAKPSDSGSPRL